MAKRLLFCASPVLLIVACTASKMPTEPTSHTVESGALAHVGHGTASADSASADTAAEGNPSSGAHDDKGTSMAGSTASACSCIAPRLSSVRNRQTAARAPAASSAPTPKRPQDRGQSPPSTPSRPPVVFNRLWTRSRAPRDGLSQSPAHDRCITRWRTSERTRRGAQPHPQRACRRLVPHGQHSRSRCQRLEPDRGRQESG